MRAPEADALLRTKIASLASLYDRFAHALDPFEPERDEAERMFMQEIATWYDSLESQSLRCKNFDGR